MSDCIPYINCPQKDQESLIKIIYPSHFKTRKFGIFGKILIVFLWCPTLYMCISSCFKGIKFLFTEILI